MKYERIERATFLERPNRFIAYARIAGKQETIHVKNTGRCAELLVPEAEIFVQESDNPERKTKWDLIGVRKGNRLINMDSQVTNKVVQEWIEAGRWFKDVKIVRPEVTYKNSRFDLYVEYEEKKAFIEVKGVTLEEEGVVKFPDAPSERAVKHLKELEEAFKNGVKLFLYSNPNNPTGALYPESILLEIIKIAREHNLIIYADEVYDKVLYDGATHTALASLSEDVLTVSFNGLSKNYRSCGYRAGWMVVSGNLRDARDYIEGLDMLASMRLCANVPGQYGIQTALGGYQSIDDLVAPTGRLYRQRDLAHELITSIPGVSCVKPKAALYMFPRLDSNIYPIQNDQAFIAELLREERVLLVQGTGFNWPNPDHFRLVFLPHEDDLREAIGRVANFLEGYRKRHGT